MGLFKSLVDLTENVVDIAIAPVEIAIDVTNAAIKPVADLANEVVEEVKYTLED